MKGRRRTYFNTATIIGGCVGQTISIVALWGATQMDATGIVFCSVGGFGIGYWIAAEMLTLIRKYKRKKRRKSVPDIKLRKELPIVDTYKSGDFHYVDDSAIYSEIRTAIRMKNSKNKSQKEIGNELLASFQRMGIMSPLEL